MQIYGTVTSAEKFSLALILLEVTLVTLILHIDFTKVIFFPSLIIGAVFDYSNLSEKNLSDKILLILAACIPILQTLI